MASHTNNNKNNNKSDTTDNNNTKNFSNNDLFDNPMVRHARANMNPQEMERYKMLGEQMFNSVDFVNAKPLSNPDIPHSDALAYLHSQLKSGLHPSMLADNEKELLTMSLGKEWYKQYDYTEQDLERI